MLSQNQVPRYLLVALKSFIDNRMRAKTNEIYMECQTAALTVHNDSLALSDFFSIIHSIFIKWSKSFFEWRQKAIASERKEPG